MRRRGQIPGFITGVLVALLLPMLWRGDIWLKYAAAMQTHSALYRGGIDPAPGLQSFPATIEGMPTDLLGNYAAIPYADFSLHALLRSFNLEPAPSFPFLVVVGAAALSWLWWRRGSSSEGLLAGLLAWLFLFDLALPAYRNIYNDVLVLNLAALALFLPRTRWPQRFFFIALPIGWAIDYFAPMHDWMIDLPSACYTAGAVGLLF
jgi:hypothetical protein